MILVGLLKWWYTDGWLAQLGRVGQSLHKTADRFSIGLLLKTLFAPFRQNAANESAGEAGGKMNLFLDKLISRVIGCIARLFMIIAGTLVLLAKLIFSAFRVCLWPTMPVMPVLGLILMVAVGAPWKLI